MRTEQGGILGAEEMELQLGFLAQVAFRRDECNCLEVSIL
jgi:hypothetical protein